MRRFRVERSLILEAPGGAVCAWVAGSARERLLGLAGLAAIEPGRALLIPRCAAVHTAGMRFAIDVAFLAWPPVPDAAVLAVAAAVPPLRSSRLGRRRRRATAVLETRAGTLAALGIEPGATLEVGGFGRSWRP